MKRTASSLASEAKFRSRVEELGGVILEPEWLGVMKPHRVRCAKGHDCTPAPNTVISGKGLCVVCGWARPNRSATLFRAAVARLGGEVLELEWFGRAKLHRVRCANGHEGATYPESVLRGGGICRTCAGQDPIVAEAAFRERLATHGSQMIEERWLGTHTPHRVRCSSGHVTALTPGRIRDGGSACRVCSGYAWDAFYLVVDTNASEFKFGVTSGATERRRGVHRTGGFKLAVLDLTNLPGTMAPDLERHLINCLPTLGHAPTRGREYFALDALPSALSIVIGFHAEFDRPASADTTAPALEPGEIGA